MLVPHLHQEKAVDALFDWFDANPVGQPLLISPVGSGKSLVLAEFIRRACTLYGTVNFLVLTHSTELLTQDANHLRMQAPHIPYSFYAAKLGRKSFDGQTIFASINSIYKKAYKIPKRIDLIFIDEAHLVSHNEATMYQTFLKDMLTINPDIRIIGLTGTGFRATSGKLTEGEGRLFTDVAYQIPMLYLIEKGFLCPLVTPPKGTRTKMSTAGIKTRDGDYIESQLQAAVDKDYITRACVDEIIEHGQDRKKWIVFTAGVDHCTNVVQEIRSRGISCEMVLGSTPTGERNRVVNEFKKGELRCLVNVGCMTTGFDCPATDLMAFMRPTRSEVLAVQMGGRGMRTHPGKTDCLLLDFGGVIDELGPIDLIDAKRVYEGSGDGDAPIKLCPACNAVCFAGVRKCQDCGHEFEINQLQLTKTASTSAAMSNQVEPEWHKVLSVSRRLHKKEGKIPSMCVTYNTLDGPFREWICYEHTGFAREKAARWHKRMSDDLLPTKIADALACRFKAPKRVLTRQAGKFHEVLSYEFGET